MNVVVVVAMREEIEPLLDVSSVHAKVGLLTGPGKVNAAAALGSTLCDRKIDLVLNLGTAGRLNPEVPLFVPLEVGTIIQWDTDLHLVDPSGRTNLPIKVTDTAKICLATGDRFVTGDSPESASLIQRGVDIVDMEAYALARTCRMFGVDFRCVKIVSDDGDIKAWRQNLPRCADALHKWFLANVA